MARLFLDTTYDLSLGFLDDKFRWLELKHHVGQKASTILQKEAYEMAKSLGLKISKLDGIISVAGPGFYTGLRLSEGFGDIFKIFQIPSYAFYSYDIPLWCGFEKGVWVTKAYRGEYFLHHWNKDEFRNELLGLKDLPQALSGQDKIFIHSASAIDQVISDHAPYALTSQLLLQNQSSILERVIQQHLQCESFYFRAPEDEFKVNP